MEKDILLVNCPPWGVRAPPFGLAYLESYLEDQGFSTDVLDMNIEMFNMYEEYSYIWDLNVKDCWSDKKEFRKICRVFHNYIMNTISRIVKHPAKVIGFSVSDPKQYMTMVLIRGIKHQNPNKIVICGGPYYFDRKPSKEDKKLIDLIVFGEGEKSISLLLKRIKDRKHFDKIPGTIRFRKGIFGKKSIFNPRKTFTSFSLRDYCYPKYKNFKLKLYKTKSIHSEWSRGCIANCSFCQNNFHFRNYSFRKPESILEEISYNYEHNNIKHISLVDPSINGNMRILEKTCDLLIDSKLEITWSALAIPRKSMTFEILKKMRKAGCIRLEYGIESGSDKVLEIMNKLHRTEESEIVLKNTRKVGGIEIVIYIMVGYPEETEEEFQKTLDFLKRNKDNIDVVRSINTPYLQKGTELHKNHTIYGIKFPSKGDPSHGWYTDDGNTLEVREDRVNRTIGVLESIGVYHNLNLLNTDKKIVLIHNKKISEFEEEDYHFNIG